MAAAESTRTRTPVSEPELRLHAIKLRRVRAAEELATMGREAEPRPRR